MYNVVNGGECLIEQLVSWCVGGGFFCIFNYFIGFDVNYDYIVSGYDVVIDVGRFDYKDVVFVINGVDVVLCECD